jgi:hypothetical protein
VDVGGQPGAGADIRPAAPGFQGPMIPPSARVTDADPHDIRIGIPLG